MALMRSQRGNASVEFIGIAVVMMVPLAYAVIALAQLQGAVYGINGAAQMAARAYMHSSSDLTGRYAAARSAAIAGRNHGLLIDAADVRITCGADDCLVPGQPARVRVDAVVRITVAPFARTVALHAEQAFTIDRFRQLPA